MPDRPSLPVLSNLLGQFTMSPRPYVPPAWPPSAWQFTMSPSASPNCWDNSLCPLGLPKTFHGNTPSPISVTRYNRPKSSDFLAANSS